MKFKTFEVFDRYNTRVFNALDDKSVPTKAQVDSMIKNGYKFKIDGKFVTKKFINEFIKK